MEKFRGKYRITSFRLQGYDYGKNGAYFITICTDDRVHFFGNIGNGEMCLNESGRLAEEIWMKIPEYFPFIRLGEFVIMPNHMHGVLIIGQDDRHHPANDDTVVTGSGSVEARLIAPLPMPTVGSGKTGGFAGKKNPMLNENIARVIRWYKGRCTFEIRKHDPCFKWQSLYYDHIIRDSASFERIQNYIINNPRNWKEDRFHP